MHGHTQRLRTPLRSALILSLILCTGGVSYGDDTRQFGKATHTNPWRESVELGRAGEFAKAADVLRTLPRGTKLTDQVLAWLDEYEAKQVVRKQMDEADFEKYVRYAKERIEREEYRFALDKVFLAADVAKDRKAFLESRWVLELVNSALTKAEEHRRDHDWRGAWHIYADLNSLYKHEPRYEKLEREVQTHWRLDTMFEEETHWKEQIEKVRWEDAETALEFIGLHYVTPPDFQAMCASGLEQLLILADSKSAQKAFDGLANEDDRADFKLRVQAKLNQVRSAPTVSYRDCVSHFRRAVGKINRQTVRMPEALVVSELMRGALAPLDDYTTIIWPTHAEEFDKHTRGDFIGVGISIVKNRQTDEIEVVSPLEDSPAYYAGIQAGDIIVGVDGELLKGFSINKVVKTITGPKGTKVTLTIRRDDQEIEFPLHRELIKIQSVKGAARDSTDEARWNHWLDEENGIAYIRLTGFQRNTEEDVANILSELEANGLEGLILDLRGNPGGLLDSAWQISKMFLERGETVVSTKGRDPTENQTFRTRRDGAYSDLPVAILTDEGSASASEIVAGAVRDNHRGPVIGERTFGKFSVQNLIPLGHSTAKLKITTAKYYLPSGVSLHRSPNAESWGVEPDIRIRLVRKEKMNVYQMRRDAQIIGPRKKDKDKDKDKGVDAGKADDKEVDGKDAEATKDGAGNDEKADLDALAETVEFTITERKSDKPKLPP
ncbi:MAG: S41 family peptidase, partial [Planctomycetes bacterium]|nr:S41 family peptidase [Planctomycetota bacterium]